MRKLFMIAKFPLAALYSFERSWRVDLQRPPDRFRPGGRCRQALP